MITALERRELIQERNNTETPYPATACIHQLFEEQVERTPDAMAALTARYEPYRSDPPAGPLLVLEPERLLWWHA